MPFLYVLLVLVLLILVLLLVCLIRALALKPTPAKDAVIKREPDKRDLAYSQSLAKMISCETVSEPGVINAEKFAKLHRTLEELFPNLHKTCEKKVFEDMSLLYRWQGKSVRGSAQSGNAAVGSTAEPILLMSHQDVVEASGSWRHPPFAGEIHEGKIWGRGTADTKGNLFCIMQAVEELIAEGVTPNRDVYIASGANEEVFGGGATATAKWLEEHGIRLKLVLDEGGMVVEKPVGGLNGFYGAVGVLEKGYADVKITARSRGGHSSAPTRNTPLVRLGRMMADIDKKSPYTAKLNPTVKEMFKRFAPNMDFGLKFMLANLWLFEPVLPGLLSAVSPAAAAMIKTTVAFTTAKGSGGLNVLPQEAYVTANLRFIPHQDSEESLSILADIAKKYDAETEPLTVRSACPVVPHDSDAFRLVESVMEKIYPGVGVTPYVMTGGTDARNYTGVCDNVLRFAPLYIDQQQFKSIHGLDENINCAALGLGVDFFKELVARV